jgi:GTP-binding protein Era
LLPYIQKSSERFDFKEIVPVSALQDKNLERLTNVLLNYLPVEAAMYPAEMLTDRGVRFQAAEVIREKLMMALHQEIPYGIAVEINELGDDEKGLLRIDAIIWVDRESHKGIVVGKQGQLLKKIGSAARVDLEERLKRQLHLETRVKLKSNWADNAQALRQMGYDE